jgi:hypothetical protein
MTLLLLTRGLKPSKLEDSKIKFNTESITDPFTGTSKGIIPS